MREVALAISGNELILPEPPMRLLFRGLGDNALNLELYVHVRAMGDRLDATDHLLGSIYDALNAAGISIPFPQRDIHFGDIDRIEAALRGARPARASGPDE